MQSSVVTPQAPAFFAKPRLFLYVALAALFLLGMGVRLAKLTYPLVFVQPVWSDPIFAIFFWLIGGVALYDLAHRLTSVDGGLTALAFYFLHGLGVEAIHSQQPDAFLVMCLLGALAALYRWSLHPHTGSHTWRYAAFSGILGGLAILTRVYLAVPSFAAFILLTQTTWGVRKAFKDRQAWLVVGLMLLIPVVFYSSAPGRSWLTGIILKDFNPAPFHALFQIRFWFQWLGGLNGAFGLFIVFLGLLGVLLLPAGGRALGLGLWVGCLAHGIFFPAQTTSLALSQIMLVPTLSLSLSAVGAELLGHLAQQSWAWRVVCGAALVIAVGYAAWVRL